MCSLLFVLCFWTFFAVIFFAHLLGTLLLPTLFLCAWKRNRKSRGNVTILPFTLCFLLLIPGSPSFVSPLSYPCCHSFRPLWQSCLANSFPSAISSFATLSAALGSYAYSIRSHIVLALMSSSPPLCHIALLLLLSLEHSILPLLTDDPVTFYDIPWYSGSCALPSSTFYALLFA